MFISGNNKQDYTPFKLTSKIINVLAEYEWTMANFATSGKWRNKWRLDEKETYQNRNEDPRKAGIWERNKKREGENQKSGEQQRSFVFQRNWKTQKEKGEEEWKHTLDLNSRSVACFPQ